MNLTRDFLIGISKASLKNNRYKTNIWKRTPSEWNERMYASCEGAKPSAKFCGVPCCQNTVLNGADGCSFGGWSSKRTGPRSEAVQSRLQRGPTGGDQGALWVRNPTPSEYEIRYAYNEILPWWGEARFLKAGDLKPGLRRRTRENRKRKRNAKGWRDAQVEETGNIGFTRRLLTIRRARFSFDSRSTSSRLMHQ